MPCRAVLRLGGGCGRWGRGAAGVAGTAHCHAARLRAAGPRPWPRPLAPAVVRSTWRRAGSFPPRLHRVRCARRCPTQSLPKARGKRRRRERRWGKINEIGFRTACVQLAHGVRRDRELPLSPSLLYACTGCLWAEVRCSSVIFRKNRRKKTRMHRTGGGENPERKSEGRGERERNSRSSPVLVTLAQTCLGKVLPKRAAGVRFGK